MSLARLFADGRPPRSVVAFGRGGVHDFEDFHARVAGLAGRLRETGAGRWLVHCEDAYAFAVSLFAVAHAGATALLLPNRQPGALARGAHLAEGALLDAAAPGEGRAPFELAARVLDPLADAWRGARPGGLAPLDLRAPLLELSTSGTTGEGKAVPKALRHLEAEVAVLEACFGGALGPATQVFATASPQHLYGLLFRVLWPLAAGRPFHAQTWLHAEELLPRIEEAGDALLASTPAHLSRMSGLGRLRGACREVFSSGGPLGADTADAVRTALGRAPVEVFGSTETGGVAWRRQEPGEGRSRWTPLPGVRVERVAEGPDAGRLRVRSPFVSSGARGEEEAACTLGDLVEIGADGRFLLLGRGDRVLKVGEKRLALPEMESQLRAHPFVAEAALLGLEQGGETRVAAALVLTPAGRGALAEEGRRSLSARLAEHLAGHWDRVLLPRAWRYVDALPRDAQGKLPVALLRELFAGSRQPLLHAESRGPASLVRDVSVPDDLVFLEGHFEGFPVVPGVVQVGWVLEAAQAALGEVPRLAAVENLKFKELLLPGQRFRLEVEWTPARDVLRFRLAAEERVFSTGRLRLREAGAS